MQKNTRVMWHFIMSYHGDGRLGTITGEPFQNEAGDWLVLIRLDESGREIRAAIESLDPVNA